LTRPRARRWAMPQNFIECDRDQELLQLDAQAVKRGARHLLDLLPPKRELRAMAIESRIEIVLEHLGIAEEDQVDVFRGPGVGSEAKLDGDSTLEENPRGISSSPPGPGLRATLAPAGSPRATCEPSARLPPAAQPRLSCLRFEPRRGTCGEASRHWPARS
jgi:hypothetical protein